MAKRKNYVLLGSLSFFMKNTTKLYLGTLFVTLLACKKSAFMPVNDDYKIIIERGEGQSDSIGKELRQPIVVRAAKNGIPLPAYYIKFEVETCENLSDTLYEDRAGIPIYYYWKLNSKPGAQVLKVTLLDENKIVRQSAKITADALGGGPGWYRSSCLPNASPLDLAYGANGRLWGAFPLEGSPFFSDDNGVTWSHLRSFNQRSQINNIIPLSANEMFILTANKGVSYSSDGGYTWEFRNPPAIRHSFYSLQQIRKGTLFLNVQDSLFYSTDKGKSWKKSSSSIRSFVNIKQINSHPSGDIYALSNENQLLLSKNEGATWSKQVFNSKYLIRSLFIDEDGTIYLGVYNRITEKIEIIVSQDNTVSWTTEFSIAPAIGGSAYIGQVKKQFGFYSFYVSKYGIVKTSDFKNFSFVSSENTGDGVKYLFTQNNSLVTFSWNRGGLAYFKPE